VVVLYAATLFLSSALLFLVQPMFARMLLPLLGGAPAVWNTCVVFFEAMLLAGYVYAHVTIKCLGVRRQAALHLGLLLLPLGVLPIAAASGWNPPGGGNPIPWLLGVSLTSVGAPIFVVAATAPMLQKWFATTAHPAARDPYFLYGASNLGSIGALLAYPALLESRLRLATQSRLWTAGYAALVVLTVACATALWRAAAAEVGTRPEQGVPRPTHARRLRWVALSFVPSSLMLGVTTHLSTDVAAVPLLWILPLALYLLTFVLTFRARPRPSHHAMVVAMPLVLLPLVFTLFLPTSGPAWFLVPLHLLAFFLAAMVCHGELSSLRPGTAYLTEFYLWVSMGGVLGGLFNTLVAPLVFTGVAEYPFALVLACLLRPARRPADRSGIFLDVAFPLVLGLGMVVLLLGTRPLEATLRPLRLVLVGCVPAVVCFGFSGRPLRFALGVAALLMVASLYEGEAHRVLLSVRSFFGVLQVNEDPVARRRELVHGTTVHGYQSLDAALHGEPLAYYHRTGPIGQVLTEWATVRAPTEIAVVGLGAGTLASYGRVGQHWTFYEIDPAVERIARDPRYFTFLQESAATWAVIVGDARLSLAEASPGRYDLIVLDAFSSDAVPVHLITSEAVHLYSTKLAAGGLLAFHISNRHLTLQPVLARVAADAGLVHRARCDQTSAEEDAAGKAGSLWLVMAARVQDLGPLAEDPRWSETDAAMVRTAAMWTDDFSNVLGVLRWR
jgi:hypothetical protein